MELSLDREYLDNIVELYDKIDELLDKDYDWEYLDYIPPTKESISNAKNDFMQFLKTIHSAGYRLDSIHLPYISNSDDGGATFAWRRGEKSLFLEFEPPKNFYTKIWSQDGKRYIQSFDLENDKYVEIWEWINDSSPKTFNDKAKTIKMEEA